MKNYELKILKVISIALLIVALIVGLASCGSAEKMTGKDSVKANNKAYGIPH